MTLQIVAASYSTLLRTSPSCPANPPTMPPRRSRSREREPLCGPSPQEPYSNRPWPPSSKEELFRNSRRQTSGESTPQPRPEDRDSNTNVESRVSTTSTNGLSSRSDSILKTPQGQQQEPGLKEVRSPTSIPTSPNYFDLLSEEEEEPPAADLPLPAGETKERKRVSFAPNPPRQVTGFLHADRGKRVETKEKPPPQDRPTWKKKKQQKQKPLFSWVDPVLYCPIPGPALGPHPSPLTPLIQELPECIRGEDAQFCRLG